MIQTSQVIGQPFSSVASAGGATISDAVNGRGGTPCCFVAPPSAFSSPVNSGFDDGRGWA